MHVGRVLPVVSSPDRPLAAGRVARPLAAGRAIIR